MYIWDTCGLPLVFGLVKGWGCEFTVLTSPFTMSLGDPVKPGMAGRERGIRNGEEGMSLCPSRHKPGNTLL